MNAISNYGLSLYICVCVRHSSTSAQQNANNGQNDDEMKK